MLLINFIKCSFEVGTDIVEEYKMKMKKFFVVLTMLLICLSVFATGSKEHTSNEKGTVSAGKLIVATSPDFAPYEFYAIDSSGKPHLAGFDMALAQYIADYMGLQLEVIPMDFDGILAEVQMGSVDLGISGFSPTPERAEVVDLSNVYYSGKQCFFSLAKNAYKFPNLEATNNPKYKIGAQTGAIQVGLAEKNSPNADIVKLTKVTDIVAEVLNGKLDGAYVETAVAESYVKNYPELQVCLTVPFEADGSVIMAKKGSPLMSQVNAAIAKCIAEGTMGQFVEQAGIDAAGEIIEGLI